MTNRVTRLAPSPTGTLHLGNVRAFLANWAIARNGGWRVLMRIEDLDAGRVRPGAAAQLLDDLRWLGLDFDDEPVFQSHDLEPYRSAMHTLAAQRLAYRCDLTRKQVQMAASAPHADTGEQRYDASLRPSSFEAFRFDRQNANYRFATEPHEIGIEDQFAGRSTHDPHAEVGDIIIWTKAGVPAYQLAAVVDDARQGVTDVVRGDDLLPSAARQTLLYRALGLVPPTWWHLPLVTAEDGRRLAKRNDDSHIARCRAEGVRPERIIGLMAHWCGIAEDPREMSAAEFAAAFEIKRMPRTPVAFGPRQQRWLWRDQD
jgi:glutamyl-tRNA synthetase